MHKIATNREFIQAGVNNLNYYKLIEFFVKYMVSIKIDLKRKGEYKGLGEKLFFGDKLKKLETFVKKINT